MNGPEYKPIDSSPPEHRPAGIRIRCGLLATLTVLALALAGCAVGPDYKRPAVDSPKNFRSAAGPPTTNSFGDLPWWQIFQDDTLQDLIKVALTNNYDLRIAVGRVEQARAINAQNRAGFFPSIGYELGIGRGKRSAFGQPIFSGTTAATANSFLGAGNVSWEIDLWGRIRRLNEASQAQFLATQEARRGIMISLISNVAQSYFQLLALDLELDIARQTTNSFGGSLKIFSERLQSGVVSKLETSRAEAALASTAANVPDLERQIIIQENVINVLLGRNPGPVYRNKNLLQEILPPKIPAGLPSSLLERRPDIRQAEQLLRSANAQIGVAKAEFFPSLDLTALFGVASPELSALASGQSGLWSIAADITGPIFQGGRLVGQYREAKALREIAILSYQQTILNAFQEVSNTLIARQKLEEVRIQLARAVNANQEAVKVSTQRYIAGKASYFEVLEAQQELYPAQNALVETQLNQLLAVVQLYRALGGGWEQELTMTKK